MPIDYRVSLPWNAMTHQNRSNIFGKHMGNLFVHACLFVISCAIATLTVHGYKTGADNNNFKTALFEILSYHTTILIFVSRATIICSYFAYELVALFTLTHAVNIYLFYSVFKDDNSTGRNLLFIVIMLKVGYILYVLRMYRQDEYQIAYKRFGSNIILYSKFKQLI